MDDVIVQKLLQTNKPAEKAAVIAEYFFSQLSVEAAKVARQCVIFHWFDNSIIEALLQETKLSSAEKEKISQQLAALPFMERLPWGHKYQIMTREGLLSQYSLTQSQLLQEAARLATPIFVSRKENKMSIAEGLFCCIVAGNRSESMSLLDEQMDQAIAHEDWSYAGELIRLQDEAERFPFVLPLTRTEKHWIHRGTVHRAQGKLEDALADYEQAIRMNSRSIPAYIGRGKVFAKQQKYKRALADYNYALKFEPTNIHIYTGRSGVYTKQGQYEDALHDLDQSLEIEPDNPYVLYNKGTVLSNLEQVEQALAVYNVILHLYPTMVEAHISKGQALFDLQRYAESLTAYDEAIRLDRYLADAQRGKGNALLALKRYAEAQLAYEEAKQLDFYTTGIDDGLLEETPADQESFQYNNHVQDEQTRRDSVEYGERITSLDRSRRKDRSRRRLGKRKINRLGFNLGRIASMGAVAALIIASLLLFRSLHITTITNINATATANANATAIANVHATAIANAKGTAIANANMTATAQATSQYPPFTNLALNDPLTNANSASGWASTTLCQFTATGYQVSIAQVGFSEECLAGSTNFSDFAYQVTMTITKGDCGGLIFRAVDNQNFYLFEVCQDGRFDSQLFVKGASAGSTKVASSSAIHTGFNQVNTLAVVVQGNTCNLYANGQPIDTFTDSTFTHGQIGVLALDITSPTAVNYTNALVWTAF